MAATTKIAAQEPNAQVSPTPLDWSHFILRTGICIAILCLFWIANTQVLAFVQKLADNDAAQIAAKQLPPADRVITPGVIMALIAGTVSQVAVVLLGITRYLFPATA
jgi:hypothetical protein